MKKRFLLLLVFLFSGCAGAPDLTQTNLSRMAASEFGSRFFVFYVPSSGALADATFVSMSKSSGPSAMAKQLAKIINNHQDAALNLCVGGPNADKSAQVTRDALRLVLAGHGPQLHLLYVGDAKHVPKIKDLVHALNGKFRFMANPPTS